LPRSSDDVAGGGQRSSRKALVWTLVRWIEDTAWRFYPEVRQTESQSRETVSATDLQDRLGILALLAVSAPFGFCKLMILLAVRETNPASGHHPGIRE
jgi:hypothetical protein